ncbi:putative prolyl 4-hydroxylase 7 [Dorcoceras hygrometricum]|uniref:Putative prolyl 4-hydroxylase 7 n=1 Tax=Dorcoceras hygrometricum TaxID=472368 RepID=A0A2Z7CTL6_9LAMI|nr:putative prolyl 4-hydroxylase 7 [Dorcoceras hygrometricum]
MSLFDLQDVCIAIGSLATLDLPMIVDLIGIYGLKGPYCTLTKTNWFLQALYVIPRGSWGDVARRSYHDPMGKSEIVIPEPQCDRSYDEVTVMGMNRMFIRWTRARWAGPSPSSSLLKVDLDLITHNLKQTLTLRALVAAALSSLKSRLAPPPPLSPEFVPANLTRRIRPRRSRQAF